MGKSVWSCVVALMLGGCALWPFDSAEPPAPVQQSGPLPQPDSASSVPPRPDARQESSEIGALLAYYQALLSMAPEELRREYQTTNQSYYRDRSELGRLRLALLMCVPAAPWRDDAKLLTLLEGAMTRPATGESPRRQFAAFLHRLVAERLREQKRADELQQKLDSLLSIERSLRRRPEK